MINLSFSVTMRLEKETKNTYRYEEETAGQPPVIKTLYIQKWKFEGKVPERIKVTVEFLGEE